MAQFQWANKQQLVFHCWLPHCMHAPLQLGHTLSFSVILYSMGRKDAIISTLSSPWQLLPDPGSQPLLISQPFSTFGPTPKWLPRKCTVGMWGRAEDLPHSQGASWGFRYLYDPASKAYSLTPPHHSNVENTYSSTPTLLHTWIPTSAVPVTVLSDRYWAVAGSCSYPLTKFGAGGIPLQKAADIEVRFGGVITWIATLSLYGQHYRRYCPFSWLPKFQKTD